ncbi:LicD family protein [Alkalibacter rhizosphaerae]|uniref:LicD family protein n=1 Tax=Alkalibacter rhizosphaerae TaxID=2815577 RepID=A0A974XIZ5_9FIRM|nr:LicD family protein [Alkalibacter rhizosphaerae]QSX09590.1 LicD family protein [Alkalibacter rhizosphaerae]
MIVEKIDLRKLQLMQLEALMEVDRVCRKQGITYYLIGGSLIGAVRHQGFVPWDDDIDIAMMRADFDRFVQEGKGELDGRYFLQTPRTDSFFYQSMARVCIMGTYVKESYSEHLKFNKSAYVDIFPLDQVPEDPEQQRKQAKEIRRIDQLIFLKSGYVYNKGFIYSKWIGKKIVQKVLLPLSFSFLMDKREKTMRRYEESQSSLVCSTASRYSYEKQIHPASRFGVPVWMEFEGKQLPVPADWDGYLKQLYGNYMELPPVDKRKPEHHVYFL